MVTRKLKAHVTNMESSVKRFPEVRNRKLKEQAIVFFSQHNVTETLEKLLNELFLAAPNDVYGYMSEYFSRLSLDAAISGFSAHEGLDCCGGKSVYVDLHCTINGVDKVVSSSSLPVDMWFKESDKDSRSHKDSKSNLDQNSEAELSEGNETFVDVLQGIRKHLAPILRGLSPKQQKEVDKAMINHISFKGCKLHPTSILLCSCVSAIASAQLLQIPLWHHLSTLTEEEHLNSKFTMPFPVASAIAGGSVGIGKLKFQEYCITSLPGSPFQEQIKMLSAVHAELRNAVMAKFGPLSQGTLPSGAFCPAIDKPEQGLDLIREAARNANLELDKNIGVFIDVGADKLYDESKGKYELVAGQWKSCDEVINLYADLLQSYPGLVGYVDPLHHQDVEGWIKLEEKLGSKCLLIADNTLHKGLPIRPVTPECSPKELEETKEFEKENTACEPSVKFVSCAAMSFEPTLTAMIEKSPQLKGYTCSGYVMLRVPHNMSMNTMAADMAVALHCRFVRLGAPSGMTSCALLSRLLHIREELVAKKLHEPAKAHLFSCSLQPDDEQLPP